VVPLWKANKQTWPPGVRTIGENELDCLGIDRTGNLYRDGKPIEVRNFSLTPWQRAGTIIVTASAAAAALATTVQAWVAACEANWLTAICGG
jgi:hypothetical protein